eukprot:364232-Chlamydomonas_euryale.AAC.8
MMRALSGGRRHLPVLVVTGLPHTCERTQCLLCAECLRRGDAACSPALQGICAASSALWCAVCVADTQAKTVRPVALGGWLRGSKRMNRLASHSKTEAFKPRWGEGGHACCMYAGPGRARARSLA